MQSIARDSDDSSDEEFFDAHGNHTCDFKLESIVRSIDVFIVFSFPRTCLLPSPLTLHASL